MRLAASQPLAQGRPSAGRPRPLAPSPAAAAAPAVRAAAGRRPRGPAPPAAAQQESVLDSVKRIARKVQGALPVIGLLSRLTSPEGGFEESQAYPEFCRQMTNRNSDGLAAALAALQKAHGKPASAKCVYLLLWMAVFGAGIVPTRDVLNAAKRLRVTQARPPPPPPPPPPLPWLALLRRRPLALPPPPRARGRPLPRLATVAAAPPNQPRPNPAPQPCTANPAPPNTARTKQDLEIEMDRFDNARTAAYKKYEGMDRTPPLGEQLALAVDGLSLLVVGGAEAAALGEADAALLRAFLAAAFPDATPAALDKAIAGKPDRAATR